MQDIYDTRFIIEHNNIIIDGNEYIHQYVNEVFVLLDCDDMFVCILAHNYANVALEKITKDNISNLLSKGAFYKKKSEVFDDKIDIKLNMIYTCIVYGTPKELIKELTDNNVTLREYRVIKNTLINDFPELLV